MHVVFRVTMESMLGRKRKRKKKTPLTMGGNGKKKQAMTSIKPGPSPHAGGAKAVRLVGPARDTSLLPPSVYAENLTMEDLREKMEEMEKRSRADTSALAASQKKNQSLMEALARMEKLERQMQAVLPKDWKEDPTSSPTSTEKEEQVRVHMQELVCVCVCVRVCVCTCVRGGDNVNVH